MAAKLAEFKEVLATAGFLISNKLSVKAERELVFLGKRVHFGNGTILNTRRALEDALSRYVLMASRPVTRKSVQRVVGKLISTCRPSHWSHLFMRGPMARVQWDTKWLPHAPTNLLWSLSGALWFADRGWSPPSTPNPPVKGLCPQVFSDAARDGNSGRLGMCSSAGAHHSMRVPLQFRGEFQSLHKFLGGHRHGARVRHRPNGGFVAGLH